MREYSSGELSGPAPHQRYKVDAKSGKRYAAESTNRKAHHMTTDDLRDLDDIWPHLAKHIPQVIAHLEEILHSVTQRPGLDDQLEAKYRAGEQEHQREWLDWSSIDDFVDESVAEVLDLIVYQLMMLAWIDAQNE